MDPIEVMLWTTLFLVIFAWPAATVVRRKLRRMRVQRLLGTGFTSEMCLSQGKSAIGIHKSEPKIAISEGKNDIVYDADGLVSVELSQSGDGFTHFITVEQDDSVLPRFKMGSTIQYRKLDFIGGHLQRLCRNVGKEENARNQTPVRNDDKLLSAVAHLTDAIKDLTTSIRETSKRS